MSSKTIFNAAVTLALLALASPAMSAPPASSGSCPEPRDLEFLCTDINFRTEAEVPRPPRIRYEYQRKILEGACVDIDRDPDEVVARKVAAMWARYDTRLTCNSPQFDLPNGMLAKFAVSSKFDQFVRDMAKWKVDLNRIDPADGRTVLDYIKDTMDASPGSATAAKLKFYYDTLRKAGAKHRAEL